MNWHNSKNSNNFLLACFHLKYDLKRRNSFKNMAFKFKKPILKEFLKDIISLLEIK
jgi:hypothetical protein